MDCAKIGRLILNLRKEKRLTQQQLADALNISNKTISKWECGLGCPDVSLWPDLSAILGVDIKQMIQGEIVPNKPDNGNMVNTRFYVCPQCQNALFSTGSASIFCCGRKLEPLPISDDPPETTVELMDGEYFVDIAHDMSRGHSLLFAAYVVGDKVFFTRMYPEQSAQMRLPSIRGGRLYLYCIKHGLSAQKLTT